MAGEKADGGLMRMAKDGEAGLFATFGGQGYPYISELQALFADEAVRGFMKPIVEALEAAAGSEEVRGACEMHVCAGAAFFKPVHPAQPAQPFCRRCGGRPRVAG
jgi:hypothetical protein